MIVRIFGAFFQHGEIHTHKLNERRCFVVIKINRHKFHVVVREGAAVLDDFLHQLLRRLCDVILRINRCDLIQRLQQPVDTLAVHLHRDRTEVRLFHFHNSFSFCLFYKRTLSHGKRTRVFILA